MGDVGDLAKLVQEAAGVRRTPNLQSKIEHELADCLWSILVLADRLGIDVKSAFKQTMKELKEETRRQLDT